MNSSEYGSRSGGGAFPGGAWERGIVRSTGVRVGEVRSQAELGNEGNGAWERGKRSLGTRELFTVNRLLFTVTRVNILEKERRGIFPALRTNGR